MNPQNSPDSSFGDRSPVFSRRGGTSIMRRMGMSMQPCTTTPIRRPCSSRRTTPIRRSAHLRALRRPLPARMGQDVYLGWQPGE